MRKIAIGIIAFTLMCPAVISIAIHLYHLQYPRFYHYSTAEELEAHILEHLTLGETTRLEAESFLQELGINNCFYELYANGEDGVNLKCSVLSPRPEYNNSLFHYLFVVDYYNISMNFEPETLTFLLVYNYTNLPLGGL